MILIQKLWWMLIVSLFFYLISMLLLYWIFIKIEKKESRNDLLDFFANGIERYLIKKTKNTFIWFLINIGVFLIIFLLEIVIIEIANNLNESGSNDLLILWVNTQESIVLILKTKVWFWVFYIKFYSLIKFITIFYLFWFLLTSTSSFCSIILISIFVMFWYVEHSSFLTTIVLPSGVNTQSYLFMDFNKCAYTVFINPLALRWLILCLVAKSFIYSVLVNFVINIISYLYWYNDYGKENIIMYWIFLEKILSMMYIPILISIGFIILIGLIYWLSNKYDWPIEIWSLELFKKQIIVFFTVWGINIFIILAIGFLGLYTLAWNDDFLVKLYNFSLKLLTEVMTTIIIAIGYIQLTVFGGWNMYLSFKIKSELKNQS